MANTNQYYVAFDDQVFGPYSFDEVSNLGLLPDTLVSRTDSEWINASEMPELRHLFNSTNQQAHIQIRQPLYDNQQLIYKQKRFYNIVLILTNYFLNFKLYFITISSNVIEASSIWFKIASNLLNK